ncbi:integrase catalytic domain-containing protein [Trichonephila clavipes]|nr:integrase catalytic domain-containing protein [Trichonephila clavipes]
MWKTSADAPVKTYKLATVTYGTVSAPFLATRTLKALADEEKVQFPDAADRGGFELHKWVLNSPELLKDLSASSYVFDKEFQDAPVKTLGMLWDPKVDCLTYKVKISDKFNFSKRDVLSEIARLYDPLGLIGPIVTKAKIFIQELWKIKLDWSEQLPPDAMEEWMNFYQKLSKINNFKIPRSILLPATIRIEIHGFSDALERAYAAVVYIKCFNESGQSQTRLLCSKSRVAPLKTLTIPRLELSAALLLSRLVKKVVPILQLPIHKIWMWTDSTIALAWIKTEPHKLKTFVSNRVAEIQALSKDYHWKHVSSKNNPADIISRGCNVDELLKNEMWYSGPDLQTDEYEDNQLFPDPSYRDELKCAVTLSMTECSSNFYDELFNVTNNFIKLIRIFSFIFRFINNIKAKESCNKEKYLTTDEIKRSTEFLAKIAQLSEFKAEINALKKGKGVSKTSKLKALDPFLDENSLLRVGGRLSNADLPFEAKHQIIIPSKHKFTKLLFEHMLKKFFHIGAHGLVHQIRMQFWPINGKGIARKTVHDCIACFRQKPTGVDQLMENLPSERERVYLIHPLSDNINEYEVLTPGHFIIGRPISAIPEPEILDISDNRLSRWQYTTKCVQTIWKRWKNDYLNHLQQRNKWQFEKNNVAVGCLVLLKENDLPPCKWAMAKILEVIYGTDVLDIFQNRKVLDLSDFQRSQIVRVRLAEPNVTEISLFLEVRCLKSYSLLTHSAARQAWQTVKYGSGSVMICTAMSWFSARPIIAMKGRITEEKYREVLADQRHPMIQMFPEEDGIFQNEGLIQSWAICDDPRLSDKDITPQLAFPSLNFHVYRANGRTLILDRSCLSAYRVFNGSRKRTHDSTTLAMSSQSRPLCYRGHYLRAVTVFTLSNRSI